MLNVFHCPPRPASGARKARFIINTGQLTPQVFSAFRSLFDIKNAHKGNLSTRLSEK